MPKGREWAIDGEASGVDLGAPGEEVGGSVSFKKGREDKRER